MYYILQGLVSTFEGLDNGTIQTEMFTGQRPEDNMGTMCKTFYGQYIPTPQERTRTSWPMNVENSLSSHMRTFTLNFSTSQDAPEIVVNQRQVIEPQVLRVPEPVLCNEASPGFGRAQGRKGRGNSQKKEARQAN